MRSVFASICIALSLTFLSSCATTPTGQQEFVVPKTPIQSIYALEISLTAAVNAVADLHNQGILVGPNYDRAKLIEAQAHATLIDARNAAMAQDATRSQVYLTTLASLVDDLAKLNGGVK